MRKGTRRVVDGDRKRVVGEDRKKRRERKGRRETQRGRFWGSNFLIVVGCFFLYY